MRGGGGGELGGKVRHSLHLVTAVLLKLVKFLSW